ncbi:MAG: hypothetical protein ACOWYE_00130 [Desulfatiglandales bacterium]
MELRLEPDTVHCIESVTKKRYNRVLNTLLKGGQEDEQLLEELELLRLFLETGDFRKLRGISEEFLRSGKRVEFILRPALGSTGYELEIIPL